MSTDLTPDMLRDLSVGVVEGFLNDKIPLSTGIAKQAAQLDLNPEQIQRAVETVNTITYLKGLQLTEDRTFEFPLAKQADVMAAITMPDKEAMNMAGAMDGTEPSANAYPEDNPNTKPAVGDCDSGINTGVPVSGEPEVPDETHNYPEDDADVRLQEKMAMLHREVSINEGRVAQLRDREITIVPELLKAAELAAKDAQFIEKLAHVTDDTSFKQLSFLAKKEIVQAPIYARDLMFKEADLKQVRKLADLYKEANQLRLELEHRVEFQKKACELEKSAGLTSMLGRAIGGAVAAPAKLIGNGAKALLGRAKTVGSTAALNTAGRVESAMTGVPFERRAVPPASPGFKKGLAVAGVAGSAGLDASMYHPGTDQTTGTSGDVWDALQGG